MKFDDISPVRRESYFRIINNEADFHPITYRLHYLNMHFPDSKLDLALSWLVKNNVVGQVFLNWFKVQCSNSDLEMHSRLLTIVDNSKGFLPIVAGKNFKL